MSSALATHRIYEPLPVLRCDFHGREIRASLFVKEDHSLWFAVDDISCYAGLNNHWQAWIDALPSGHTELADGGCGTNELFVSKEGAIGVCVAAGRSDMADWISGGLTLPRDESLLLYMLFNFKATIRREMDVGYVYFAKRPDGQIKIGTSTTPSKRIRGIETTSGLKLKLLGLERGGQKRERELHAMFASSRTIGEWFRSSEELLAYIDSNATECESETGGSK